MPEDKRPSKREAFMALLQEGWTSLHLDARRAGVVVPQHLRSEIHLVLQYGYDLPIPIPDLDVSDAGVRATLSFSRNPEPTIVPWSAVYVVSGSDGRGVIYQEDVPAEVMKAIAVVGESGLPLEAGTGPTLRAVPAEATFDTIEPPLHPPPEPSGTSARRRRKPQLRLVK